MDEVPLEDEEEPEVDEPNAACVDVPDAEDVDVPDAEDPCAFEMALIETVD